MADAARGPRAPSCWWSGSIWPGPSTATRQGAAAWRVAPPARGGRRLRPC